MTKRTLALLGLVAFVGILAAAPAAAVQDAPDQNQTQSETQSDVEGADLLVEQPTYVDNDLVRQSEDGVPVYVVEGSPIRLYPESFEGANVTEFGLRGEAGTLQYQSDFGRYQLSADETGSYRLYWEVEERVAVERNNETVVATETQRYEAVVRIDGQVAVSVRETGEFERIQTNAQKWQDLNATLTDMRNADYIAHRVDRPDNNEDLLQSSLSAYKTTRSPLFLLQGGFTAVFILLFTSAGGLAALIILKAPDLAVVSRLRAEIRKRRGLEQLEGDVADRQEELDLQQRLQNVANWDWQDIPSVTDHEGVQLRKSVGVTPLDGLTGVLDRFMPDRLLADRVRAMDQAGYVAQEVGEDGPFSADGGHDVRLVKAVDVLESDQQISEREDLKSLSDPPETLLSRISDDDPARDEFDPRHHDIDPTEFTNGRGTMSLPELIDEFDVDDWAFEDDERLGEILVEFVEMLSRHPVVDDDGSFDDGRLTAERLLQILQFADDRGDVPLADWYVQHFDTALAAHDRDDELAGWLDEHRSGFNHHNAGAD